MSNALRNTLIVLLVLSLLLNACLFLMVGNMQLDLDDSNLLVLEWCEYSNDVTSYSNDLLDNLYYYDYENYYDLDYIYETDCFDY